MKKTTFIFTQKDVKKLIDTRTAIRTVRKSFISAAAGKSQMPSKVYLTLARGDFRAMPAYVKSSRAAGIKWVNVHKGNPARGLPTVMAIIIINDCDTGFPLAVMDGLLLTQLRTAAAGAVAAKALARKNSRIIGLVGCGAQAEAQVIALNETFRLKKVYACDKIFSAAQRFCRRMRKTLKSIQWIERKAIKDCVQEADIIVTLTPSRRPLVMRDWIKTGAHINAIGADAPGKQELDYSILKDALVVVDEQEQAMHGGEINMAIKNGKLKPHQIHANIGEVLSGQKRGRHSDHEITVFDSTGLAIHDVALGAEVVRRANRKRIGRKIQFFEF